MREHMGLYRGKRIDNGEWVEGSFLQRGEAHRPLDRPDIQFSDCYIVPKSDLVIVRLVGANVVGLDIWAYHVDPKTVGECTGLRDKNGRLIFEGDIISIHFESDYEPPSAPEVWYAHAEVVWQEEHLGWYASFGGYDELSMWEYDNCEDVVVIGNIHDNPELLKGGEG